MLINHCDLLCQSLFSVLPSISVHFKGCTYEEIDYKNFNLWKSKCARRKCLEAELTPLPPGGSGSTFNQSLFPIRGTFCLFPQGLWDTALPVYKDVC